MQPNQCAVKIIDAAEQCVVGIQMNRLTYQLNELLVDCINSQEKGNPFNYSWILILISFVTWIKPPYYQGVDVPVLFWGEQYQKLSYDKENTHR